MIYLSIFSYLVYYLQETQARLRDVLKYLVSESFKLVDKNEKLVIVC